MGWGHASVFILTCLAILPFAKLLGDMTNEVAMHTNQTLGGLLNATFGNATEIIVSVFALRKGLVAVVQASLLGSILSNTLLVFGCACLAAGLRMPAPRFNKVAAASNTSLLLLAILGILVPTILHSLSGKHTERFSTTADLKLSRAISVVLLLLYVLYIYFQLFTHRALFDEEDESNEVITVTECNLWARMKYAT